jgi:hypothetical protein
MHSFLEYITEAKNSKSIKPAFKAEDDIKKNLSLLGHPQCHGGGCRHEADATVGGHPVSIGYGNKFSDKDLGQVTLHLDHNQETGKKEWSVESTAKAIHDHIRQQVFDTARKGKSTVTISKRKLALPDLLSKHYGTNYTASNRPIKTKKGKEPKHFTHAALAIERKGEIHLPLPGTIIGQHMKSHHGEKYHIQHTKDGRQYLYRTSKDNPLMILDKNGKHPPIYGSGAKVEMRIRAKESTRHKKTGFYKKRGVGAVKILNKVTPSTIDLSRPHETIHSSSGIFTNDNDRAKAKAHEKRKK